MAMEHNDCFYGLETLFIGNKIPIIACATMTHEHYENYKLLMIKPPKPTLFFLLCILNLLLPHWVAATEINVSVDRNPVSLNESFQIIFTANESPDADPDFSALEQNFSILSQSNSSSASWVNGQASKTIQWTLNVMAKNTGSLIIPPVKFGNDSSQAMSILVTQGKANNVDANEDLFMEVEATPASPYVQSQVIYTLRLYTRIEIAQARLNEPEASDAVIEKLGEDSNYNTQVKGMDYSVTERKYAVFPQKSGSLTIKPLVLTAEVLTNNRSGFNGFFSSQITQTRRVTSKEITLDVKPAPASFTGAHWLSAEQLELKQEWSGDINQMKVGEPLTRTLTLSAKGATVGQLPELSAANTDGQLKTYPDQPVLQEQKKLEGLVALRQEKIALIPSKAGDYTLPAIEIPWFNTQSQKMEVARIPETKITAIALVGTQATVTAPETPVAVVDKPQKVEPAPVIAPPQQAYNIWIWISVFLASGWLVTLIFFLTRKPAKPAVMVSDNPAPNLKDSVKNLKKACSDNDALAAKAVLIEWGRQKFNVASLGAVAIFCDARLRDEILQLNRVLYGKEKDQWQGKKLFQAFAENKAREKTISGDDSGLEPLYRL